MDEIILVEYNPDWLRLFAQEEAVIRRVLPATLITRIEHIGSTAVPGLVGKPIIDLLIGVPSVDEARQIAVRILEALGYSFWADDPRRDHLFLVKGLPPNGPRSHHIHVVEPQSTDWDTVLFRDYLCAHPEEAVCYSELKRDLASRYRQDREAYTQAKTDYIQHIVQLARR